MRKKKPSSHRLGMTLSELLIAMALLSVVSLVTLELYLNAYTEFQHSSGTMVLNQRARTTIDRITMILKTAAPALANSSEAFIHPNAGIDMTQDMYETDFVSTIGFLPNSSLGSPAWKVTDTTSAAYVGDASDPRWIYETDGGLTAAVTRQPSLYRYRIAWNHTTSNLTGGRSGVPGRAVYFERLRFADGSGTSPDPSIGANSASYSLSPWIADTGSPYSGGAMKPRILGRNVHYLTFTRTTGNVILLRMKLYNRDPITNEVVEGLTMARPGKGGNADPTDPTRKRLRYFVVDLTTNVQLPNTI